MTMKVPKMVVADYLKLLRNTKVTASKEHALVNQDVRDGFVYFRTSGAILAFKNLLRASELGTQPETEVYRQKTIDYEWDKETDGLTVGLVLERIENIREPDGSGYYTGRCPSCAKRGKDSDSNHFRFNPEQSVIYCFSQCSRFDIVGALK